jgi:hypothetical protein
MMRDGGHCGFRVVLLAGHVFDDGAIDPVLVGQQQRGQQIQVHVVSHESSCVDPLADSVDIRRGNRPLLASRTPTIGLSCSWAYDGSTKSVMSWPSAYAASNAMFKDCRRSAIRWQWSIRLS